MSASQMLRCLAVSGLVILLCSPACANPVLVSSHTGREPQPRFAVKYHSVDVTIEDQAATTVIEQVFVNESPRDAEGTYLFPISEEASITDFAMWMNGEKVTGELLEADEARHIYREIVRRTRDPGLLEYAGRNLYRARVFPIPAQGEVKVELSYREILEYDAGLVRYAYPLDVSRFLRSPIGDVSVSVSIESSVPIKNLYSPTHPVDPFVDRTSASCGFEFADAVPNEDFVVYYTVSDEDVGLNLLAHRAGDDDGYFMLLVSPGSIEDPGDIVEKDVIFVIDRSGSMRRGKIEQAKSALAHCLENLSPGDRFRIITFSTQVREFRDDTSWAEPESLEDALAFVGDIEAGGSTNIDAALGTALATPALDRPQMVVFLTDGLPTTGVKDIGQILANAADRNEGRMRIFAFGVGHDVNSVLLDRLAIENRGTVQYVAPGEDVGQSVSSFYDKVSKPVLSDIAIDVDGATVHDVYPMDLPDIFSGTQAVILGRYEGSGAAAVRLSGRVDHRDRVFTYDARFPESEAGHDFVPALWAARKIAYLTTEIRLYGQDPELRDEVVRLATEHGIVTQYTSYLVREQERDLAAAPGARPTAETVGERHALLPGEVTVEASRPTIETEQTLTRRVMSREDVKVRSITSVTEAIATQPGVVLHEGEVHVRGGRAGSSPRAQSSPLGMQRGTGKQAFELSRSLSSDRQISIAGVPETGLVRRIGEKVFFYNTETRGWVDSDYEEGGDAVEITYLSEEYFALLEEHPEIGEYLALGESVTFVFEGKAYRVVPEEVPDE